MCSVKHGQYQCKCKVDVIMAHAVRPYAKNRQLGVNSVKHAAKTNKITQQFLSVFNVNYRLFL